MPDSEGQYESELESLEELEEPLGETNEEFKEATGIDLTDMKWITEDPVVSHDLPNRL